jgi:hypothetical protein
MYCGSAVAVLTVCFVPSLHADSGGIDFPVGYGAEGKTVTESGRPFLSGKIPEKDTKLGERYARE